MIALIGELCGDLLLIVGALQTLWTVLRWWWTGA